MKTLDTAELTLVAQQAGVKPRIRADLKFTAAAQELGDDWSQVELAAFGDKAGKNGVLLLQPGDTLFAVPYEISPITASSQTGRARSIICDFCYTWQRGSNAGSITLIHAETKRGIRFLCCGDLRCSQNVRTKTKESILSRTQLRENLDDEDRVLRLKERLVVKIQDLALQSIEL